MKFSVTNLSTKDNKVVNGPLLISPKCFEDARGFFLEEWNESEWIKILEANAQKYHKFVQDNFSKSFKGVLRGLHFQINPYPQSKLVRCVLGEIFDVAVDLRKDSPTFGRWISAILSNDNLNQLWIPEGFAHGFLTLSDIAFVQYKVTNYWSKKCENSLIWNDEEVNIDWPFEVCNKNKIKLSNKDSNSPSFNEIAKLDFF
jgi:dTDP-4-dehydrorhamnose 3,5-epimerase